MTNQIIITASINAPISKVWECWTSPEQVMKWNHASEDWHCPEAKNDLTVGGRFCYKMAAKDGSVSFDFEGTYTEVEENEKISYSMDDGRKVSISFKEEGDKTVVTEAFDPETINSLELQKQGWQAILDNFKEHTEKQ